MFCKRCGKEIPNDSNVCQHCGSQVTPRTSANTYTNFNNPTINNSYQAPPAPQKKQKKTPWKIIAPIVAVLLIIAIVFGVFACANNKKKAAEEKLRQILAESTTKPVVEFMCEDYDGDGTFEAYAVVGDSEEKEEYVEYYDADICFVNETEAEVIKESVRGHANGTIEVGNTIYVSLEVYDDGAETGKSFIYTAADSEYVESDISGKYSDVREEDGKVIGKDENGNEVEIELTDINEDENSDNNSDADSRAEVNPNIIEDVRNAKVGDIVEFGSYPQSEVKDPALLEKLNSQELNWVSYGYYSGDGSDKIPQQGDSVKYADVIVNDEKYRAVTFSQYRPYYPDTEVYEEYMNQYENGYKVNVVYFFKYEPLKWRVLDSLDGFIMCENIIDSLPYAEVIYRKQDISFEEQMFNAYNDKNFTNYANDYETSTIRTWLNIDFYNATFVSSEKNLIKSSRIDNRCTTSGYEGDFDFGSDMTEDKIFLLSHEDALNSSYGFISNENYTDVRAAVGTDYSKAQGLNVDYEIGDGIHSPWWLRSAESFVADAVNGVGETGAVGQEYYGSYWSADEKCIGVRPALKLNME